MSSNADVHPGRFDTAKLSLSVLLLLGGMFAFYYLTDQPDFVRVLAVLGGAVLAVLVGSQTAKGRQLLGFMRDAQIEVRRVVWPTRQETVQTTLVVIAVTLLVALFLWMLDGALSWTVRQLTSLGG